MKILKCFTVAVILTLTSQAACAESKEIEHLFSFVASTECAYERNGKTHTGKQALKHIKKKFDYFRDDIHSTEDFIAYSATKSKMSGKPYKVSCPDQPTITSAEWLLTELQLFRQNKSG